MPFAVVVLGMAHQEKELVWVVVLQTVAANLGSVLTPVGNPQNLYLYSRYGLGMGDFLSATLPLWLLSLLAVLLLSLRLPKARVEVFLGEAPCLDKKGLGLYLALILRPPGHGPRGGRLIRLGDWIGLSASFVTLLPLMVSSTCPP